MVLQLQIITLETLSLWLTEHLQVYKQRLQHFLHLLEAQGDPSRRVPIYLHTVTKEIKKILPH